MSGTDLLVLLTALGAATVGGVFYGFSTFVMKALAQLPAAQGVAAMQRINIVVINPWFMGAFMGTLLLSIACVVVAVMAGSAALLAGGLLYALGTFGVTMAFNVPRNNRLARLEAASSDAAAYWPAYVREWTRWNHVRTAAALVAAACAVLVCYN